MRVAVIGGGPAGLMAAETAAATGASVHVFEQKRSVGRKFLVAGKGGLNLTHSEPLDVFLDRYGASRSRLEPFVRAFPPEALRAFAEALGQKTWVGSSGRVFPEEEDALARRSASHASPPRSPPARSAKAAPLLRAWVARLKRQGVAFHAQRVWLGWSGKKLRFRCPETKGDELFAADTTVLALGGASWPETGSDGAWTAILRDAGVDVAPLVAANAGWIAALPEGFGERFEGAALKSIAIEAAGTRARGDVIVTKDGIEGTPVYRLGPVVRGALPMDVTIDLKPDSEAEALAKRLAKGGSKSRSTKLKALGLDDAARALASARLVGVKEPAAWAAALKRVPLTVTALRPIEEAISSAGGVKWTDIDDRLMLVKKPGVFVAGEMIDWEAPTGGYLLQACFSTGRAAGAAASQPL